jgi:hypothetical protein
MHELAEPKAEQTQEGTPRFTVLHGARKRGQRCMRILDIATHFRVVMSSGDAT